MLDYGFFYDIAEYGNANWNGNYTNKEVACNAYNYLIDYKVSKQASKLTLLMQRLIELLQDDGNEECEEWLYQITSSLNAKEE